MGVYIGNNNVAKKIKNIYVGINGVARKVVSAYVGVNGVARKIFSVGSQQRTVSYYGTAPDMSTVRCDNYLAGVSFNGYAVFGGGVVNTSFAGTKLVDAYDSNLTLHKLTNFTTARGSNPSGSTPSHCIFAGGRNGIKSAEAYNTDLTKVSSVPDLTYSR